MNNAITNTAESQRGFDALERVSNYSQGTSLIECMVLKYKPAAKTMTCLVVSNGDMIECTNGLEQTNLIAGIVEHRPIPEMAKVLVRRAMGPVATGVIVAVLAVVMTGTGGEKDEEPASLLPPILPEADSVLEVPTHKGDYESSYTNIVAGGSPIELLSTDWAQLGPYGTAFYKGLFHTTVKAGERAKFEQFVLDELTRLTTHYYEHISANGYHTIYSDNGYVTEELHRSDKECKLYGLQDPDEVVEDTEEMEEHLDNGVKVQAGAPLRDISMFTGAMSQGLQVFLTNNQGKAAPATHLSVLPDGATSLTSARSLSLRRSSMVLKVPKRYRDPEDPEGDTLEEIQKAFEEDYVPFKYSTSDHNRNLQELDSRIYELKACMQRFDAMRKDFEEKEEEEANKKDIKIDIGNGFKLHDDGSVHIWDKAGSEIVLDGEGDIQISPKRDYIVRPGRNSITLAPEDIVTRAQKNIDLTADEGDIVAFAGKGLDILADTEKVVITSSKKDVMIKAEKHCMLYTKTGKIVLAGRELVMALKERINMTAKSIYGLATSTYYALSGSSGLSLTGSSALLAGKSASVIGNSGVFMSGSQVPMMVDGGASQYPSIGSSFSTATSAAARNADGYESLAEATKFKFHDKTDVTKMNETMYQMVGREITKEKLKAWDLAKAIETTDKTKAFPCNAKIREYTMKHKDIKKRTDKDLMPEAGETATADEVIYKY